MVLISVDVVPISCVCVSVCMSVCVWPGVCVCCRPGGWPLLASVPRHFELKSREKCWPKWATDWTPIRRIRRIRRWSSSEKNKCKSAVMMRAWIKSRNITTSLQQVCFCFWKSTWNVGNIENSRNNGIESCATCWCWWRAQPEPPES